MRHGQYPTTDGYTAFCMGLAALFIIMAHWSHKLAGPPNDPGIVEWKHFRDEDDRRLNREDEKKWNAIRASGQVVDLSKTTVSESWDPEVVNAKSNQCMKCGA